MDIELDLNPTSLTINDLQVVDGDLVLIDGTSEILQHILQRLRMYLGEWFLDNTKGVPYFQQILVKNPDRGAVDAILQDTINQTPGVTQLSTFSSSIVSGTRQLFVNFRAITTQGTVNYSGLV